MSASRKKKERSLQKAEAPQKKPGMSKATRDTVIVVSVVVVVLAAIVIGALIYNHYQEQKLLEPDYDVSVAAATVGTDNISVPILNYFYMDQINSFYNSYGSYISSFLDTSVALDQQEYTAGAFFGGEYATWDDYFTGKAEDAAREIFNLKQAAEAEGTTLSDDAKTHIDSTISSVETTATNNGFSSADLYLATLYGSGCNLENYREYLEAQELASEYYEANIDSFTFTDDEIQAAYDEEPSKYDGVTCYAFSSGATGTTDEDGNYVEATEEEKQAALEEAQAMKESFDEENENTSLISSRTKESIAEGTCEEAAEWLFDASRKEGDVEMFSTEDGDIHYVVKFVSRDDRNYDMANLKVIYISKNANTDEETDAETLTGAEKYQTVLDALTDNQTEENFDALIQEYSEDSSVASDNGVKENVTKNSGYGEEATEWIFSNPGEDTWNSFETDTGYYVIWHNGYGENYQHHLVNNNLVSEAQEAWYEDTAHANELVANEDMRQYRKHGITLDDYFTATSAT